MTTTNNDSSQVKKQGFILSLFRGIQVPIHAKLMLAFVLVIVIIGTVFLVIGVQLTGNRVATEAQDKVRNDLNAARVIYESQLDQINAVVCYTADRGFLREAVPVEDMEEAYEELSKVGTSAGLDIFGVTNKYGKVLLRTHNPEIKGDDLGHHEFIKSVLYSESCITSTVIFSQYELKKESAALADQAHITYIDTPLTRPVSESEQSSGMMMIAAAPIFNSQHEIIGVVYGGKLLNKNYDIVDLIKQTVYENVKYEGQDIGTATIFQDDLRISTNVKNEDGTRAIGTRVSKEVYNQVIIRGEPWIDRAYVVNNWYITAYEPIKNLESDIIGILYVGVLEQKYIDIRRETILTFSGITIAGILVAVGVSFMFSRQISGPIRQMVAASKEVAEGNLETRVLVKTNDELQFLAESFNDMTESLQKRDQDLKDFATQRIMQSEKLALIGQLSANIAHELNNPLQGIVTFSHLLLEDNDCADPDTRFSLEKIVGQANRCRDIIRGLLDFSRQKAPDKTYFDINSIIDDCISLVELQALFHNIHVIRNLQSDLPMAVIDKSQIERVFMNLIINAAEAMEGSGHLTISTRENLSTNDIEIAFSDTGPGIKEENVKRIFDPFFTTKDVGLGTGLGLAISYGLVRSHKGSILVDSEVGHGTTFVVILPKEETGDNGKYQ
ncbi:MAG: cache domain-containing protein [Anaerolineales bacterium]|nr:cache domain-containing protein [Anaerolineales bacterium]